MITKNPEVAPIVRRADVSTFRNPWNEFQEMRHGMDDLFSRYFGYTPLSRLIPEEAPVFEPVVDIYETAEELLFFVAVPGFELKYIDVSVNADMLFVHGTRKPWIALPEDVRIYRRSGLVENEQFTFNYTLPVPVDPDKVKATFHNGVLELHLPKIEAAKTRTIKVNIHEM